MRRQLKNIVKEILNEAAYYDAFGIRRIADNNDMLDELTPLDINKVVAGFNFERKSEMQMKLDYTPKETLQYVIDNLSENPEYYDKHLQDYKYSMITKESGGAYDMKKVSHYLSLKGKVDNFDKKKIDLVKKFIIFVSEHLVLDKPCKIYLSAERNKHLETTASYNRSNHDIWIYVKNRNMLGDVLRSLAHEMMHFKQNLRGDLEVHSGRDGSPHENEANTFSGIMLRKFGRMFPEIYL